MFEQLHEHHHAEINLAFVIIRDLRVLRAIIERAPYPRGIAHDSLTDNFVAVNTRFSFFGKTVRSQRMNGISDFQDVMQRCVKFRENKEQKYLGVMKNTISPNTISVSYNFK